jgi:hypothetical protein
VHRAEVLDAEALQRLLAYRQIHVLPFKISLFSARRTGAATHAEF